MLCDNHSKNYYCRTRIYIIVFNCPCLCEIIYPFIIHSITWKSLVHIPHCPQLPVSSSCLARQHCPQLPVSSSCLARQHCPQLPVSSSCLARQSLVAWYHLTYLSYRLCDYFEVRQFFEAGYWMISGNIFCKVRCTGSHLHSSCVM